MSPTQLSPPIPIAATLARESQHAIGAALRASTLPPILRLVMWTVSDLAAVALAAGERFAISLEEISSAAGMPVDHVAHAIADLMDAGWIADLSRGWLPTVPAPKAAE
jgi:hypothetical protein